MAHSLRHYRKGRLGKGVGKGVARSLRHYRKGRVLTAPKPPVV